MRLVVLAVTFATLVIYWEKPKPQTDAYGQNPAHTTQQADNTAGGTVVVVNQHTPQGEQDSHTPKPPSYLHELLLPQNVPSVALVFVGIAGIIAAIETLRHMRKSSERQLRAYVLPEHAGIIDGTMLNPPQADKAGIPGIFMDIRNFGETPAYKVVSWAQIAVIAVKDESTALVPWPMVDAFYNTLGPKGTFNKALWFDRQLAANEITDIAAGIRGIYLYGRIQYRDAFKKPRFTNFRLRYTGQFPPPLGAISNFSERGNDAD